MGGFINYNCLHAFAAHAGYSLYLFARFTYKHIRSLAHSLSLLSVYFIIRISNCVSTRKTCIHYHISILSHYHIGKPILII
jgi:hypothetical protein